MHLVYMDDSKDEKSCCFSAIILPSELWNEALDHLIAFRRTIKASHGIYMTVELHATDWIGGRGNVAPQTVRRDIRAAIFKDALSHIIELPQCAIIAAHGLRRDENILFERLCNRIQRNMQAKQSRAILISDEGKNYDGLVRKLRRFNPISGQFGGTLQRPLDRIIEDLVYRKSDRSLFIQAADFCAFSLLRMEAPTPAIIRQGLEHAFLMLEPVLVKKAFAKDPRGLGIVRST
jgi:Protein of unknown function (DUF3800)